ncbi:hypothetical protein [Microvirga flavescens]|uniref:hypothetical protein n=1 Tax=Microvirga flavescens TaxID=2249811 RepID=UPI000DDB6F74|nr:hypothetical protein [Microvirga flavescens]
MLTKTDLDGPASLQYEPVGGKVDEARLDWEHAQNFTSLREAVHWAMTQEAPAGQHAVIRTSSGMILNPDMLEGIWSSLQGP